MCRSGLLGVLVLFPEAEGIAFCIEANGKISHFWNGGSGKGDPHFILSNHKGIAE